MHGDAAPLKKPFKVAFHQGLDQPAPLSVEQLVQLFHAPVRGPCLPRDQFIGRLQPPVGFLHLAVSLLHAAVGFLHLAVGLRHAALSLLLRCGDLAQNLPNLLRGRWIAVCVAVGHRYVSLVT